MKRMLALAALCIGTICTLSASLGCDPQTCEARGESTSITGLVSYVRGTATGSTIPGSIDVFDYNQACTYDNQEFPIAIGSCTLWARLQQGAEPPIEYRGVVVFPGSSSGSASIEAGQVCDLALAEGATTVNILGGEIAFDATTTLILSGTVAAPSDAGDDGGASDAFQWIFQGAGAPQ